MFSIFKGAQWSIKSHYVSQLIATRPEDLNDVISKSVDGVLF